MDGKRKSRKGFKGSIALILAVVFAMVQLVPMVVVAGDTETLQGTYSVNAQPVITSVDLELGDLIPGEGHTLTVDITDNDGLDDLDKIEFIIWQEDGPLSNEGDPNEGEDEFDDLKVADDSQNPVTHAAFTWINNGDGTQDVDLGTTLSGLQLGGEDYHYWNVAIDSELNFDDTNDDLVLTLTVGAIARQGTGNWHIGVKAVDSTELEGYGSETGLNVTDYLEINIDTSNVTWGALMSKQNFEDYNGANPGATSVGSIEFITNVDFTQRVGAALAWVNDDDSGNNMERVAVDAEPGPDQLAIKAGTAVVHNDATPISANVANDDEIDDTLVANTDFLFQEQAENYLFIRLGEVDPNRQGASFSGEIIYNIVDR